MENTGRAKKIGNILPGYAEIPVICWYGCRFFTPPLTAGRLLTTSLLQLLALYVDEC
jgi:hypothetical protein